MEYFSNSIKVGVNLWFLSSHISLEFKVWSFLIMKPTFVLNFSIFYSVILLDVEVIK